MKINLKVYFSQTPWYCRRNCYKTTCKAHVFRRINSFLQTGQASWLFASFLNTFEAESVHTW